MSDVDVLHHVARALRLFCFRLWPRLFVRWINQTRWSAFSWRLFNVLGPLLIALVCVSSVWYVGVHELGWVSHQVRWLKAQEDLDVLRVSLAARQLKAASLATQQAQERDTELTLLSQIDELTLPWPNSNVRLILLNQVEKMASQKGLHLLQLKMLKLKEVHGYEASSLHFSLRGTAWATETFWRWLDQKLPNGQWLYLKWSPTPDGRYALEGQIQMLWDAQDAMTDTGVEMAWRDAHELAAKVAEEALHVLPHQSQTTMRIVGSAQASGPLGEALSWAFVQSDAKVHVVKSGHNLGIENSKVQYANGAGLWLQDRDGQTAIPLAWAQAPNPASNAISNFASTSAPVMAPVSDRLKP
jgi:hypothetical protein